VHGSETWSMKVEVRYTRVERMKGMMMRMCSVTLGEYKSREELRKSIKSGVCDR